MILTKIETVDAAFIQKYECVKIGYRENFDLYMSPHFGGMYKVDTAKQ